MCAIVQAQVTEAGAMEAPCPKFHQSWDASTKLCASFAAGLCSPSLDHARKEGNLLALRTDVGTTGDAVDDDWPSQRRSVCPRLSLPTYPSHPSRTRETRCTSESSRPMMRPTSRCFVRQSLLCKVLAAAGRTRRCRRRRLTSRRRRSSASPHRTRPGCRSVCCRPWLLLDETRCAGRRRRVTNKDDRRGLGHTTLPPWLRD